MGKGYDCQGVRTMGLLRQGADWHIASAEIGADAAHIFQEIAREEGSHATWLPEAGMVYAADAGEPSRSWPYEEWRDIALRTLLLSCRLSAILSDEIATFQ